MLDGLDRIDWGNLGCDYKDTDKIPDYLRTLISPAGGVRDEASRLLLDAIYHHGAVCGATVQTIPFLIRLLDGPAAVDRSAILMILDVVADGEAYSEDAGRAASASFEAVVAGADTYLAVLGDPDPEVRIHAAKLMPVCANLRPDVVPRLRAQIEAEPKAIVRARMLSTLVHCWEMPGFRPVEPLPLSSGQRDYLLRLARSPDQPLEVRFSAACILMERDQPDLLMDALPVFRQMVGITSDDRREIADGYRKWEIEGMLVSALYQEPDVMDWLIAHPDHPPQQG